MKRLSFMAIGVLAGITFLLGLYVLALVALWGLAGGGADPVTSTIQEAYSDLAAAAALKFLLLHLAAGAVLGLAAALLSALVVAPRSEGSRMGKPFLLCLGASLVLFAYMNARFMVQKPMFYDALFNARGGTARWVQNTLTDHFSPAGIDALFALFLVLLFLFRRGRTFRFRRPAAAVALALVLGLGLGLESLPERAAPAPETYGRPNILLLSFDSLRPDHLSSYGYPRKTSPHIDSIAEQGIRFEEIYVPLARTLPSWASLLTSTYPHTHGFRHMFPTRDRRKIHLPLLPRILAGAGYRSAVVSDYAGECFDMVDLGFDLVDVPPTTSVPLVIEREFMLRSPYLAPFLDHGPGHRLLPLLGFLMINADPFRMADRVIDHVERFQAEGKPFFLTAFFSCTHIPYAAPYPFYKRFTKAGYEGIHKYGFGIQDIRDLSKAMQRPPKEEQRRIIDLYDGAVAAIDEAVGEILAALEEMGIAKSTIILVSADHGETLYDHGGLLEHGERLTGGDEAHRCPLILYDPEQPQAGRRISAPVSTLDVMPTLLRRLGLPAPPEVRGRDLTPLLEGKALPDRPLFAETGLWLGGTPDAFEGSGLDYPSILYSLDADPLDQTLHLRPEYEHRAVAAKQRWIRTGKHKLVYIPTPEGAEFHLYDVIQDPGNGADLYKRPDLEAAGEGLKRRLFEWMLAAPGTGLDGRLHMVPKYTFYE